MYLLASNDKWKQEFSKRVRAERRKVDIIRTTNITPYLRDYAFYMLSPLYVHAGIGYSLPDQFELEAGDQNRIIVDYQRTVIGGLGKWSSYIEGISLNVWEDFCHYLNTCLFVSLLKSVVWQIRSQFVNVEGTDESSVIRPNDLPVRLCVFMPDGNKGRMCVKGGYPAKLWWEKSHPEVFEMSKIVLECKGRIEDAS